MASIFISHSSHDKQFANQLASDLEQCGHAVWLDDREIRVGQSIPKKVSEGLQQCEVVIVVFSEASTTSGWVATEWESRLDDDIKSSGSVILPIVIDDCEIPQILRSKKYADFRKSHRVGFAHLCSAIDSIQSVGKFPANTRLVTTSPTTEAQAVKLITDLGNANTPLSSVLPRIAAFAKAANDKDLAEYSLHQIRGIVDAEYSLDDPPMWARCRVVKAWVSLIGELNLNYLGWSGKAQNMMTHIKNSDDFKCIKFIIPDPIHSVEKKVAVANDNTILAAKLSAKTLLDKEDASDKLFAVYMDWDAYIDICTNIKNELCQLLLMHV
ncbi:MAG: toll/interleukin-1 receptor domain-containing protein [Phycisphaerales bacterium]